VLQIINAVGNQGAFSQVRVIMIVDILRLKAKNLPVTVEIAQSLFLFSVNANHRIASPFVFSSQASDLLELAVAFLKLTRGLGLDHLTLHITMFVKQFPDDIAAYREPFFFNALAIL
jgi:hypothetical protein